MKENGEESAPYADERWPSKPGQGRESAFGRVQFPCSTDGLADRPEVAAGRNRSESSRYPHDGITVAAGDLPLFAPQPERPLKAAFAGAVYSPGDDDARLTDQLARVFGVLKVGGWLTVAELSGKTGDPAPSVSAQLRHLRKPRFGGWNIEKRRRPRTDEKRSNLWEYRLHGKLAETGRKDHLLEAVLSELADLRAVVQRLQAAMEGKS